MIAPSAPISPVLSLSPSLLPPPRDPLHSRFWLFVASPLSSAGYVHLVPSPPLRRLSLLTPPRRLRSHSSSLTPSESNKSSTSHHAPPYRFFFWAKSAKAAFSPPLPVRLLGCKISTPPSVSISSFEVSEVGGGGEGEQRGRADSSGGRGKGEGNETGRALRPAEGASSFAEESAKLVRRELGAVEEKRGLGRGYFSCFEQEMRRKGSARGADKMPGGGRLGPRDGASDPQLLGLGGVWGKKLRFEIAFSRW